MLRSLSVLSAVLCAAFICNRSTLSAAPQSDSSGLLLHLPLDGNFIPANGDASFAIKSDHAAFAPGKRGQALKIAESDKGIQFPGAGFFSRSTGTVMFWVQPAWEFKQSEQPSHREMFKLDNFTVTFHPPRQTLIFMTGKTFMGDGYKWDYGCSDSKINRTWAADQWHHVAVTWDTDSGRKALYLDGALAVTNLTDRIRSDASVGTITLGGSNAPGLYDDLMIWNRVLTDAEIQQYGQVSPPVQKQTEAAKPAGEPIHIAMDQIDASCSEEVIVAPGQTYTAKVVINNNQKETWRTTATFTLLDYWERPQGEQKKEIVVNAGEKLTESVAFSAPTNGIFKIRMKTDMNGNAVEKDVASFVVLPADMGQDGPESFFGAHVNSWSGLPKQAARMGLGWVRGHNMLQYTWWPLVEPKRGEFKWESAEIHTRMQQNKLSVLGQFFGTPYWAAAGQALPEPKTRSYPSGAKPDLTAFANYVSTVVKHFPDIRYWEIWNEPDVSMFWNGSPEEFATLAETAYKAVKQSDPSATVLVGGLTQSAWRWHEASAKAGLFKHTDMLSYHAYYSIDTTPEAYLETTQNIMNHFKKLCRDTRGSELPFWDTESGSSDTTWLSGFEFPKYPPIKARPAPDWQQATRLAVQTAAILQSQGVVKSFHYLTNTAYPRSEEYRSLNSTDNNNVPKPKMVARSIMAWQLRGAQYVETIRHDAGRTWAVIYRTPQNQSVALLWAGENAQVSLNVAWKNQPARIINMMGNALKMESSLTLTEDPIYIHLNDSPETAVRIFRQAGIKVEREPKIIVTRKEDDKPAVPALPNYVAAAENPAAVFTVDLKPYATMGLADENAGDNKGGWADEGRFNDARELPTGKQTFYGVPFDITDPATNNGKSVLTLFGVNLTKRMPQRIDGIKVGQKTRVLYFLHAAAWGQPGTIGKYIIHYADGQSQDIPLTIPGNSNNWWTGWDETEDSRPVPFRVTNTLTGKPAWRYLRVWEWQNPRRDVAIDRIDVVSAGGVQTPIVVAITGVRQ